MVLDAKIIGFGSGSMVLDQDRWFWTGLVGIFIGVAGLMAMDVQNIRFGHKTGFSG